MSWKRVSSQPGGVEFEDWYSFKDYWFRKEVEAVGTGLSLNDISAQEGSSPDYTLAIVPKPPVYPPVPPEHMYPTTVIPPLTEYPTMVLIGDQMNGGSGQPWTAGPQSITQIIEPLGTLLFYIGKRVAVSLAIRAAGDLYGALKVKYHQRNAYLKVHTGIGSIDRSRPTNAPLRPGAGGTAKPIPYDPSTLPEAGPGYPPWSPSPTDQYRRDYFYDGGDSRDSFFWDWLPF